MDPSTLDDKLDTINETLVKIAMGQEHHGEKIDRLVHAVEGNGEPGMKIRVDRLEQTAQNNKWLVRALGASLIAAVVGAGATFIPSCKNNAKAGLPDSRQVDR
jgi:hypothetical protein